MKFYVHKLGCPKNDVDADYIAARLIAEGHEAVSSESEAESVIVNTCGFILPAKEESINEILRFGEQKKQGLLKTVYATGCLTQRYGDEMLADIPELDGTFGHGALDSIARIVTEGSRTEKTVKMESRKLGYLSWKDRFISDKFPYSYLKISDGCDRACTYCAIPLMRGKFRSRPLDSIVTEAEFLAKNGKKELILVSQEATMYGYGLDGSLDIIKLLQELERIEGVDWIRLMYLYPAKLDEALIEYLTSGSKTLPYFDLPLQHVSDDILTAMRRRVDNEYLRKLLRLIRSSGSATIRTTFIVGFPGETERNYEELKEFVQEFAFDRMGVFAYSAEEGTPAGSFGDQVPEEVKQARLDELMLIQQEIAFAANEKMIGNSVEIIIDSINDRNLAVGRSKADCPDIDQEVIVRGEGLSVGEIVPVTIESVDGYDLIGSHARR